jgi:hypothetical protein
MPQVSQRDVDAAVRAFCSEQGFFTRHGAKCATLAAVGAVPSKVCIPRRNTV